jgi:type II secretory pathway component PulM
MIAAWWNGLVAQERRIVAGGGLLALLMLGWAFAWHPLALKRADLEQGIGNQRNELAYVRAGAAQIEQQRATGARAGLAMRSSGSSRSVRKGPGSVSSRRVSMRWSAGSSRSRATTAARRSSCRPIVPRAPDW